jgi:hypothetical protein
MFPRDAFPAYLQPTISRASTERLTVRDLRRRARESTATRLDLATIERTTRALYFGVRHEVVSDWTWIEREQLRVLVRATDACGDIAEGGRLLRRHHELVLAREAARLARGET